MGRPFHVYRLWLIGILIALYRLEYGHQDNLHVQPDTPVLHIPDIVFDPLDQEVVILDFTPVSMHLGPAGETGFYEMPDHILLVNVGEIRRVFEHMGSGSYHGHIAHKHIKKLGQFIQVALPEETADGGNPVVVFGDLFLVRFVIYPQAPELQAIEGLVVFSGPGLYEKYGPFRA